VLALASDDYDGPPSLPSGPTSFLAARASALTSLDDRGQDLIADLLQLAPGTTTGPAIELLQSRKIVEKLLTLVDADSDGKLCFEEMTSADVVGIAEQVAADLDVQAADIEVNEDLARALIQSYQQGLKEAILPGLTDDEELPCLPITGLRSSVEADQLKLFPPNTPLDPQ